MDHRACSELLSAFVRGEAGDDAVTVAEHLEGCRECQKERAALEMLLAPEEPLTAQERARLREVVAAAGAGEAVAATHRGLTHVVRREESSPTERWQWLAPALSAAAAVILVVGGLFFVFGHGGTGSSNSSAVGHAANAPEKSVVRAAGTRPAPIFARSTTAGTGHPGVLGAERPPVLDSFAASYTGTDARRLGRTFLERLAGDAPAGAAQQVRLCGQRVLAAQPLPVLPAYGATTTVKGNPALLLEFAASDTPDGRLTRFIVFAWPRGSCGVPLVHRTAGAR
jgi:hypothetical protein